MNQSLVNIRAFHPSDLGELKRLHELYFKEQFDLPKFMEFICTFVVEDQEGIITIGGVRDIAECVAVTNMSRDPIHRFGALLQLLDASKFVCRDQDYDQMYVWSQNPKYSRRLQKHGFRLPQGQSLILDL